MAHYSTHVSAVKRSLGQNAIASAAYNARDKLELNVFDKQTGISSLILFDYSSKGGLASSRIFAPEHAPEWVYDREKLWNKCEQAENRCDGVTAGKIMVALPNEFSEEQNIALAEELILPMINGGLVVDVNIHNDRENNRHLHGMHSTRELVENRYGEMEFSKFKNRDFKGPKWVKEYREYVADTINKHYKMNGFTLEVTHKSYRELGIDLIPGVHEGPASSIKNSELTELNRQIAAENAERIKAKPSIVLDVLGMNNPVFTKEQIAIELEKRLHAGIDFSKIDDIESMQKELSATFISLYEKILVCPEISQVVEADLKGRTLYTTTKRLELEERFSQGVLVMKNRNNHVLGLSDSDLDHLSFSEKIGVKVRDIKSDTIDFVNEKTGLDLEKPKQVISLSDEQRGAVVNVLNGSDISVLEGIPGAGKTTAMREIVRQYKKAGFTVIGTAPSSAASLELAKATGIECKNASQWRKEWLKEQGKKFELVLRGDYFKEDLYQNNGSSLTKKHVMIIDEASMMELANTDYFVSEAKRVGAKILFVGDSNQLSPVGWAGALNEAISICGSEVLSQSRRQQNASHQEATKLLSQYRVREALDIYWQEGAIKVAENESEANSMAVRSFVESYVKTAHATQRDDLVSIRSKAIGVFENKTREMINTQVREQLKEAGVLKGAEYRVLVGSSIKDGKKEKQYLNLSRGEQIVFARNANRLGKGGIFNGELGTILKISKPNKDALAKIDILVHRASGKKEKVTLDLNELEGNKFTGKYFHDEMSIDYGYALTSHKMQGASIDDFVAMVEKNVGFEVLNVLATRHKQNLEIVVSKEVLYDSFYKGLDKTAGAARNRFEIEADEEVILKGGLTKIVSKRSNTSFASDYKSMGLSEEDKPIKHYLDKSEETIVAVRKITSWQAIEQRKTGLKPLMWEHKEFWKDFVGAKAERAKAASIIESGFAENGKLAGEARLDSDYKHLSFEEFQASCKIASYAKFKDRLIQLGINYATIEKHASQTTKDFQIDKVRVNQKATILHDQGVFKELVQSVVSGHTGEIRNSYGAVNLHMAETNLATQEKRYAIDEIHDHRQELTDALQSEEHYRKILTPEYLNRIYRSHKEGGENAGARSLKLYEDLIAQHGEEKATGMVVKDPTILGELKGYGVGRLFGLSNERKDAIALCLNLERQLNGFNRSGEMVKQYKAQMKEASFGEKLFALTEELEHLRSLLPADIDNEFLKEVDSKLHKTKGNNIDWRDLQKSELFEAVRVNQYAQKETAIVVNHDRTTPEMQPLSSKLAVAEESEVIASDVRDDIITAKAMVDQVSTEPSKEQGDNIYKNNKPRLTFVEVKAGLNSTIVSEIFRKYGNAINPDDKIEQRGDQITVGSLRMRISGDKMGLWHRFSDGTKGDIFSFVEAATGCSKHESLEIVASHASIVASNQGADHIAENKLEKPAISKNNAINEHEGVGNKDVWSPVAIIPESASEFKPAKDLAFLAKKGSIITSTHEYRNKDNQLLGYSVRIEDFESKKQVLPVAYTHNEALQKSRWGLMGFSDAGTNPIYNLEKLVQNPDKPILIVEGEKAADAASKLMPDYVVVSWMGGAQGVDKVDWSKLSSKIVSIWPDNDKPGILAAQKIANHIDCHNGFTGLVHIVDTAKLGLPKKWDLADEIPKESVISHNNLANIVDEARISSEPIGKRLAISQKQLGIEDKAIHNSIEMLVVQGRIEKDEYSSLAIYQRTICAIGKAEGIELAKITDHQEFVKAICDIQSKYQSLHREYDIKNQNYNKSDISTKDRLAHDLVRDASVLHQVELCLDKLSKTHIDHIEQTVKSEIGKMHRFTDSDQEQVGNNICKIINSDQWRNNLDARNQEKTQGIYAIKEETNLINSTLKSFRAERLEAQIFKDIFALIHKEQEFLSGLANSKHSSHHSCELNKLIIDAKENKEKNIVNELEKAVDANRKQAIKTDKELIGILNKEPDNIVKTVSKLREIAEYECKYHLGSIKIQMNCLSKLNYNIDKDQLVGERKSMSPEDRDKHADKIVAREMKKYVEPLLKPLEEERAKATNIQEIMPVLEKQHQVYLHLHKEHEISIYTMGDKRISLNMVNAYNLERHASMKQFKEVVTHAVNSGIKDKTELFNDLKESTNMNALYKGVHRECINHHKNQIDKHLGDLSRNSNVYIDNRTFKDPVSYLNYRKTHNDRRFMPIDHINKQLEHIQHQNEPQLQKNLNLNKGLDM